MGVFTKSETLGLKRNEEGNSSWLPFEFKAEARERAESRMTQVGLEKDGDAI